MLSPSQGLLFEEPAPSPELSQASSSTFIDNMRLPVHRWFRYSAGFSAAWAGEVIRDHAARRETRVLDPFAGSGTTLLAAEEAGVSSVGVEAHPFVARVARAKLRRDASRSEYETFASGVLARAKTLVGSVEPYPPLIRKCYDDETLRSLDCLKRSFEESTEDSPAFELTWLTLVSILRKVSHAGTAQWQYVLPNNTKRRVVAPFPAFEDQTRMFSADMGASPIVREHARILFSDARTCEGIEDRSCNLVVTSPPYPNNYDYADATRLEMSFMGEVRGWGDLQEAVRRHLVRSCSQHVPERAVNLESVVESDVLSPIRDELHKVTQELAEIRLTKGGKKTYHLMIACYTLDLAKTWRSLRRVCDTPSDVCFVIGDSAPYGVYVPVIEWFGKLSRDAGFGPYRFEQTRERNVKWKNRKHRVPLCEGRFWVEG